MPIDGAFLQRIEEATLFDGRALPAHLKAGLVREWERLQLVEAQLKALEAHTRELIEQRGPLKAVHALMLLSGMGWVGAWTLVLELLGWREIANRRQLGGLSGLVPAPYNSGSDQGIVKRVIAGCGP